MSTAPSPIPQEKQQAILADCRAVFAKAGNIEDAPRGWSIRIAAKHGVTRFQVFGLVRRFGREDLTPAPAPKGEIERGSAPRRRPAQERLARYIQEQSPKPGNGNGHAGPPSYSSLVTRHSSLSAQQADLNSALKAALADLFLENLHLKAALAARGDSQ